MPARFRRIIHQQAQVSSFESFYSKPESLTIVLLSKYIEYSSRHIHGITKLLLENALAIRPCNCEAASEPLLPKVACCIPVLSFCDIGKCASRVLKCSEQTLQFIRSLNWQLSCSSVIQIRSFSFVQELYCSSYLGPF